MANSEEFPFCNHADNCACSQGVQSYVPHYSKVLKAVRPVGVFEWGPGKNTQMALSMYSVRHVVSVEQEKRWIPEIHFKRQTVLYMQTGSEHYTKGYPGMWDSGIFDLFFVDSRRRAECISEVYDYSCRAKKDAVLCLHDAQRRRYHKALEKFTHVFFPHKGFAIATNCEETMSKIKQSFLDSPHTEV